MSIMIGFSGGQTNLAFKFKEQIRNTNYVCICAVNIHKYFLKVQNPIKYFEIIHFKL